MHVLVLDSDETVRKAIRAMLLSEDHTFEGFASCEELTEYLSANNTPPVDAIVIGKTPTPDLVSYDEKELERVHSTRGDDDQALVERAVESVRQHKKLAKTPIVVHAKATLADLKVNAKLGVLYADKFAPYGTLMRVLTNP